MKFYAFLMYRQFVLDDISIGLLVRFLIRNVSYKEKGVGAAIKQ